MSMGEQTRASGRGARWLDSAELVAAGAVLALVPRDIAGTPGVWPLAALLVLSSLGLWLRGASWSDVGLGGGAPARRSEQHGLLGVALGALAALAASFVVGPGLAAITSRGLDAGVPAVQGSAVALVLALLVAWAHALGAEMVFRGWLLDRIESVWPGAGSSDDSGRADGIARATGSGHHAGRAAGPLVLAGLAYGWYLGDGSAGSFASAALVGVGLCFLRRAGQGLLLPIATHGAYASTHLALVYAGVLGGAG